MGNQEENVLLRFQGEDAGASSTLEELVALMQDTVVAVDDLIAAGYKMSDINKALDLIAGGASAASESIGELGAMTKEAALALGQANDILNTGAEAIDTFAKDSLSGAEALGALGQQTSALSKEMDTAWFEVDHGVELLDGLRNAAVGADAVFSNFDNQIGLYDEMMSSANDRTNAFTMTVTGAKESTTTLAQAMYDAAEAVGADGEVVYELAERLGVLADAEGQAFKVAQPLVQVTSDFSATAQVAETRADALATSFKGIADEDEYVVSKVNNIVQVVQELGLTTQEVMAGVEDYIVGGFFTLEEAQLFWQKFGEAAAEGAQQVGEAAQTVGEAEQQIGTAAEVAETSADALTTSFKGTADELATLTEMFSGNFDLAGLYQAGYAAEQVQAAMQKLIETADPAAAAFALVGESAASTASAFDIWTQALMQETQVVSDYQSVLGEMNGAMEAATAGTYAQDQAIADATTTYNELDDAAATSAYEVEAFGEAAQTAGEETATANDSFGASQYLLLQLGFMAFSAAQQFLTLGANIQDSLDIIQGKTGASDAQMQQWKQAMEQMGHQGGYSMQELAQGLDIVTQAQFKGADATNVLQYGTELARASGEKLTDSTNLLAMSLDAFGAKASDAHTYAAILFDALSNGKQNVQQLANTLGPIMGEAAQAGISFSDLVGAEAQFSRSTSSSMEATRKFQSLIMALAGDTQLSADQLAKLGLVFDQTKFQTLDFAGKLENLAKYADGNVQEFIKLVGGTKDVQSAMDTLGISTNQLAKNAENLGLSFDPIKYKAMDAGDKLYYLLQVSGYNEAEFKKLTDGGLNPLNVALEKLDLNTNDVAAKVKQMGLNFDEAKFSSDTLQQKLWMLWDASGHNIDAFGKLIGGSGNVGAAFNTMGLNADGTGKKQDALGQKSDDLGNKHLSKTAPIQVHMLDLENHMKNLRGDMDNTGKKADDMGKHLDSAFERTSKDVKASAGSFSSGISDLAQAFVVAVGPVIIPILNGLGTAAEWASHHLGDLWNAFLALTGPLGQIASVMNQLGPDIGDIINWLDISYQHIAKWVNDTIDIFSKLHVDLVGNSIVPDMIDAINTEFLNAGPMWLGSITTDINGLLGAFGNLATQMYTSASHAVDQFIAGLLSKLPGVENAASQIAQKLASYLHFSVPELGPLHDADRWMEDFGDLLATGLNNNVARLAHASSQVAQSLIPPVGLSTASPFASQQSVAPIVSVLNQILAVLQSGQSGQASSGAPPSVTLNNFGGGSTNVGQIASQLDQLSGIRFEAGLRGGF